MADTNTVTAYQILGGIGNDTYNLLLSTPGITDAYVLALAAAIKGVTPPAGIGVTLSVTKSIQSTDSYTGSITSNPPAFT